MSKLLKTTIQITDVARTAYLRLTGRYSGKLAVSAGLLLLDRLDSQERERIIDEANGIIVQDEAQIEADRKMAEADHAIALKAGKRKQRKRNA